MASNEQVEFYDKFIDYFEKNKDNDRNLSFRKWIMKWIGIEDAVLDFGCATGYNSALFKNVVGVDISPKCVEKAKETYPQHEYYAGDITDGFEIPYDGFFKWIILSDVLEHVPEERRHKIFTEVAKKTKAGSVLIGSVPNYNFYEVYSPASIQPVEECVELPELLAEMAIAGFTDVISLFRHDVYYRFIISRPH